MPKGNKKSRTLRKVPVKTPSGKTTHYKQRKHNKAKCGRCGNQLPGVETGKEAELKKLSKTEKRPERPYGGILCSKCSRRKIIEKTREEND